MERVVKLCKRSLQRRSRESRFVLYVSCRAVGKVINARIQADNIKYFTAVNCKPDPVQLRACSWRDIHRLLAEFPGTLQTWSCLLESLVAMLKHIETLKHILNFYVYFYGWWIYLNVGTCLWSVCSEESENAPVSLPYLSARLFECNYSASDRNEYQKRNKSSPPWELLSLLPMS
jgi:hypothetical protein